MEPWFAVEGTGASGPAEHVGVEGVAELVGGQVVQAGVVHERGCAGEPIQQVVDAGPHALPGRSPGSRRARWPKGAGEIEEMRALGLVGLPGAGERFEHAVGDAVDVPTLDPVFLPGVFGLSGCLRS